MKSVNFPFLDTSTPISSSQACFVCFLTMTYQIRSFSARFVLKIVKNILPASCHENFIFFITSSRNREQTIWLCLTMNHYSNMTNHLFAISRKNFLGMQYLCRWIMCLLCYGLHISHFCAAGDGSNTKTFTFEDWRFSTNRRS